MTKLAFSPAFHADPVAAPSGASSEAVYGNTMLGLLARDLHRAISRAIDQRVAPYGIASSLCRYLAVIRHHDGITSKEISDFLGIRSPTAVAALSQLEAKRMVARTRRASDGRKSHYSLTALGAQVEGLARSGATSVEEVALSSFSPEKVQEFLAMVQIARQAVENSLAAPFPPPSPADDIG